LSHYFGLKRALVGLRRKPCVVIAFSIKNERAIGLKT